MTPQWKAHIRARDKPHVDISYYTINPTYFVTFKHSRTGVIHERFYDNAFNMICAVREIYKYHYQKGN